MKKKKNLKLRDPRKTRFRGLEWGWKVVEADLTALGFQYVLNEWAVASKPIKTNTDPCPWGEGDGLCLARNFYGAAQGGRTATNPILICAYDPTDVLGFDSDTFRVSKLLVAQVWSLKLLAQLADLSGADLSRANLSGADLSGANLSRANLSRADLSGAIYLTPEQIAYCKEQGAIL